jgi:hypothetical protein
MVDAPATISAGAAATAQRTPEMKALIQEIVNRPGNTASSAMAFIITGSGTKTARAY